jgi:cell division protein FtsQ
LYALARDTSMFGVTRIKVSGASPALAAQVRRELVPLLGASLVGLDGAAVERRVDALPAVVGSSYDRDFPHTLRVTVTPERPVGVLRAGRSWWLVSARARVIARIPQRADSSLPRIWLPAGTQIAAGEFLAPAAGGAAARALSLTHGFPARIVTASTPSGSISFRLGSGVELRLGDPADMPLKLAVAARALPLLPPGTTYLDVSLPGRPVAGGNSQLSAGG